MIEKLFSYTTMNVDHPAVCCQGKYITYSELLEYVKRLEPTLSFLTKNTGTIFPLITERSVDYLIGIFSLISNNQAYHPMEYEHSSALLINRLKSSGYSHIYTSSHLKPIFESEGFTCITPQEGLSSTNTAFTNPCYDADAIYVKSTSGISGHPKDVLVTAKNVQHYTNSLRQMLGLPNGLNFTHVSSLSADLGNTSIFLALATGGCLHILDDETRMDPQSFWRYLSENNIHVVKITPSHIKALLLSDRCRSSETLDFLILGGEQFHWSLAERLYEEGIAQNLYNHYGPTETTIGTCLFKLDKHQLQETRSLTVPIGKPIGKNNIFLDNSRDKDGLPHGELCIAGPGVTLGYLNNERGNKESFIVGRDGIRYYKTGDKCLLHPDGNYEFVERQGNEVKVNGFRINLNHLESVVDDVKGIRFIKIFLFNSTLSAIIVKSNPQTSDDEITETLKTRFEKHVATRFIPKSYYFVERIPLDKNGKFSPQFLEILPVSAQTAKTKASCPLEAAWKQSLGLTQDIIDPNTTFSLFGGDSLQMIRLFAILESQGIHIPFNEFLKNPTFGNLRNLKSKTNQGPTKKAIPNVKRFSPIQKWFNSQEFSNPNHWNQIAAYSTHKAIDVGRLEESVKAVLNAHSLLRIQIKDSFNDYDYRELTVTDDLLQTTLHSYSAPSQGHMLENFIQEKVKDAQKTISLNNGQLIRFLHFQGADGVNTLIIICHHFVIDVISWNILINDLDYFYSSPPAANFPENKPQFGQWVNELYDLANSDLFEKDLRFWADLSYLETKKQSNASTTPASPKTSCWVHLCSYHDLIHLTSQGFKTHTILLAAFSEALAKTKNIGKVSIDVESHGRTQDIIQTSISGIIGWFTSLYPFQRECPENLNFHDVCAQVRDTEDIIPNLGIGYGIHKYLGRKLSPEASSNYLFNYLGRIDSQATKTLALQSCQLYPGIPRCPTNKGPYDIQLTGKVLRENIYIELCFDSKIISKETINKICRTMQKLISPHSTVPLQLDYGPDSSGLINYIPKHIMKKQRPRPLHKKSILLTGATGFLGVHILHELLHVDQDVRIICLVRKTAGSSGYERLLRNYASYFGELTPQQLDKMTVLEGKIECANLGIPTDSYDQLVTHLTEIINAAADIRLIASLDELIPTNVEGTKNLLTLAQASDRISFHHVSSLGVAGRSTVGQKVFSEEDLDYGQAFLSPYEETKLQAEKLLQDWVLSERKGMIYRTSNISAHSQTGNFQTNCLSNRIAQTLHFYISTGMAPNLPDHKYYFTPVDTVARSIVTMVLNDITGRTLHVESPWAMVHFDLIQQIKNMGIPISVTKPETLLQNLDTLSENISTAAPFWIRRDFHLPRDVTFSCEKSIDYLKLFGIEFPKLGHAWFKSFIRNILEASQSQGGGA